MAAAVFGCLEMQTKVFGMKAPNWTFHISGSTIALPLHLSFRWPLYTFDGFYIPFGVAVHVMCFGVVYGPPPRPANQP